MNRVIIASVLSASALLGAGKQKQNPTAPNAAEVAISSATIPAGGTAQVQFLLTEPKPIMSTGTGFDMDGFSAWGISVWTPTGEACGVGAIVDGKLKFQAIDPTGSLGTALDYPFLTITMRVPQGVKTGTVFPFNWTPDAYLANNGTPYTLSTKPGTVTIGGSASISGIVPGGGTWPAGTVVHIQGSGFSQSSKLITNVKFSSISIQPNDIQIVLKSATRLDAQEFSVLNTDRSRADYYAYLRGVNLKTPSRGLLENAEYAFPLATHAIASFSAAQNLTDSQFQALALQNPTTGPAVVTVTASGRSAMIVMPSGTRIVDTVSELLGGSVQPGDTVNVVSTAMVQILGVNGDETTKTLSPFIPKF